MAVAHAASWRRDTLQIRLSLRDNSVAEMSLTNARTVTKGPLLFRCSPLFCRCYPPLCFGEKRGRDQQLGSSQREISLETAAGEGLPNVPAIAPPRPWRASPGAIPACRCVPAGSASRCARPGAGAVRSRPSRCARSLRRSRRSRRPARPRRWRVSSCLENSRLPRCERPRGAAPRRTSRRRGGDVPPGRRSPRPARPRRL